MLQAYCTVCSTHFSVSHGGVCYVKKHGEGKKHKDLFRAKSQGNKMTNFLTSSKESDVDLSVIIVETLFSVMLAEHNAPLALSDHFKKLVKQMFPDSNIAKKYACGRSKSTQIVKRAIDPIQREKVVQLCQDKFSLLIDESNDNNSEKGLVILVRVTEESGVVTRFLDMPIVNIGTGDNIFNAIDRTFR